MTAMTVDPPTDRSEYVSFSTVLANTGLTRRQLDFWCHRGYITAVPGERGSGRPRVFTADEYMVICHAYDLTALGLGPEQAVALARRLRADNQPVVVEHAHTSVVVIARTVPSAGPAGDTTDDGSARNAAAPTEQLEQVEQADAASTPNDPFDASRAAAAALALRAAALCTCRHPRRLHDADGSCRLDDCGCGTYQRAVPGPLSLLHD